jgi:predicted acylesterase/phospholipase RssA
MSETTAAPLSTRDSHLFGPGPKRILAIDGGGVRGIVALAFLEKIESELTERAGFPVRLCDHFDLIGGTSTGAIIATGLALGLTVAELRAYYLELAPLVFKPPWVKLPGWRAVFDAQTLQRQLDIIIGARTLDSADLRTGLAVVLKRVDGDSSWILLNNPRSKYWETPEDKGFIGNRYFPLAKVVRASTAAPHYFDPQPIRILENSEPFVFVDGGLTPHNNPSLAMFLTTFIPAYGLGWPVGTENLTIVSVGAGTFRESQSATHPDADVPDGRLPDPVDHQRRSRRSRQCEAAARRAVPVPALRRQTRGRLAARHARCCRRSGYAQAGPAVGQFRQHAVSRGDRAKGGEVAGAVGTLGGVGGRGWLAAVGRS